MRIVSHEEQRKYLAVHYRSQIGSIICFLAVNRDNVDCFCHRVFPVELGVPHAVLPMDSLVLYSLNRSNVVERALTGDDNQPGQ